MICKLLAVPSRLPPAKSNWVLAGSGCGDAAADEFDIVIDSGGIMNVITEPGGPLSGSRLVTKMAASGMIEALRGCIA